MAKRVPWQPTEHDADRRRPHASAGATHVARQPDYRSYDAFLDMVDEDTLAEWVDGCIVMTGPANRRHQNLEGFLFTALSVFINVHALGEVMGPPFQMKLPQSGREPDVIYVATAHLDRFTSTYLNGPADLVVEIVSPESVERDRVIKFGEYQDAGIPEYWLIDPDAEQAAFYRLNAEGRYDRIALDSDGIYHSEVVPGFWLRTAWLWQQPLPDTVAVLLEIDGEAYGRYLREQLRRAGL